MKHSLSIALAATISLASAWGSATVNFSSSLRTTNLQSDGSPMGTEFVFQIGTFNGIFSPTADNTSEWLSHWVALSDAAADPLPGATANYEQRQLPAPFPQGEVTAGFAGTVELDHNQPPFQTMGAVYIWGYDNRTAAGDGEWILATSSTWGWPSGTSNPPAVTFSISNADTVVLGAVDGPAFHMQSAAVTVEQSNITGGYASWLESQFGAATIADASLADTTWGVLADPDQDGLSNVIEFYTASNPTDPDSLRKTSANIDGDDLVFTFFQAKDTTGVVASVEWSNDLTHWQIAEGIAFEAVEDLGDAYRVEARIPLNGDTDKFARLNVRRALD